MGYHDPMLCFEEARALEERRAYPRFPVALHGVCSIAGGNDQACSVVDLSLGGGNVVCAEVASLDAKVSLLLPHVGLLGARVARMTADGFGVAFTGSVAQRRRVQDYLVFVLQMRDDQAVEDRAFDRFECHSRAYCQRKRQRRAGQ